MKRLNAVLVALLASGLSWNAMAAVMDDVAPLQQRWAEVKYQTPEDKQAAEFERLAQEADAVVRKNAGAAEPLIWKGIILSTWAGAKGGLGALSLCKQARATFEEAIKIDPNALQGSAYTSLGSLYYQVPGWPLGFGDEDTARELLQQGLSIAPDGIDANYFWGDFLLDQEDYAGAVQAFQKALAAPPRPGRESADAGRRAEIEAGLAKAQEELRG